MHPFHRDFARLPARSMVAVTGVLAALVGLAGVIPANAQAQNPPVVAGEIAPPVEIAMGIVDGNVHCLPPVARLPAGEPLTLRVRNASELPITFVAPDFFEAAEMVESTDSALDASTGGFLVAPENEVRMVIRETPPIGEYGYACSVPGVQPTVESSGFLVTVAPPADPNVPVAE
ncbi:cupredoxin domain-containing protein [Aurantimonas sp. HBX-1]|uniref:cupredoxin domain-containing protein n=1 Tax=Aurantimonas sp. HBX-1 TaxID=2906072 RepID=UPI001F367798|nr:cupredoxin domain-containing protein [Aurantimonas sp. HBX-1]UIJ71006.1 cupredoxin domain-containing protein [Aurantimonas sp. HBX-1]